MKLNFWQWLGAVLLVVGGGYWYWGHYLKKPDMPPATPSPTTQHAPATAPVA